MLMMDMAGFEQLAQLRQELDWLRENHPDKTALQCLAIAHLDTVRLASGVSGSSVLEKAISAVKAERSKRGQR